MVVQFWLFNGDDKNINIVMKRLRKYLCRETQFLLYTRYEAGYFFLSGKKGKKKNKEAYFDLI